MLAYVVAEAGGDSIALDTSRTRSQERMLRADIDVRPVPGEVHVCVTKTVWPRLRVARPSATSDPAGRSALRQLLQTGETIIVDCPVLTDPNALELAAATAGVVLVLDAGKATKREVEECGAVLRDAQISLRGILINRTGCASGPNRF